MPVSRSASWRPPPMPTATPATSTATPTAVIVARPGAPGGAGRPRDRRLSGDSISATTGSEQRSRLREGDLVQLPSRPQRVQRGGGHHAFRTAESSTVSYTPTTADEGDVSASPWKRLRSTLTGESVPDDSDPSAVIAFAPPSIQLIMPTPNATYSFDHQGAWASYECIPPAGMLLSCLHGNGPLRGNAPVGIRSPAFTVTAIDIDGRQASTTLDYTVTGTPAPGPTPPTPPARSAPPCRPRRPCLQRRRCFRRSPGSTNPRRGGARAPCCPHRGPQPRRRHPLHVHLCRLRERHVQPSPTRLAGARRARDGRCVPANRGNRRRPPCTLETAERIADALGERGREHARLPGTGFELRGDLGRAPISSPSPRPRSRRRPGTPRRSPSARCTSRSSSSPGSGAVVLRPR